jgi:hypothetical protein
MAVTGVTDYAILAILRHRLHCNCALIALFVLASPATFVGVIACALACALGLMGTLRSPVVAPVVALRMFVSGPFGRSSLGTASEICRLWVPAAAVVVAMEDGLSLQTTHSQILGRRRRRRRRRK